MIPRFLTIALYEVRQYRRSYFEQLFAFAGVALIFLMVSGGGEGATLDTPASYGIYRVGYVARAGLDNYTHYSITMLPYGGRDDALRALSAGVLDVYADVNGSRVSFMTEGTVKSEAAVKRLKQLLLGEKRSSIYSLADANSSLDGILLPVKVRAQEYEVDYSNAVDPRRSRRINRAATDNGEAGGGGNILNPDDVRRMNLTQYFAEAPAAPADDVDRSGFTLPEEWEIPFVFRTLYYNMAAVSASILLSIMLTISFAREKVKNTIVVLFQTPATRADILAGKALPYFLAMAAVNAAYCAWAVPGWAGLKAFYVFSVLSLTLVSFSLFCVLASRNYREVTFMGSLSLMSFLLFIVLPNVFSGVNLLAFISPLDTVTSLQNGLPVGAFDVFVSLLPYKFLCLFFFASSLVCFTPETFHDTPGTVGLLRLFYLGMAAQLGDGAAYVAACVCLLVPFVFIVQTVIAYLILPFGFMAPYASVFLLAAVEEVAKILPYHYNRRIPPAWYGLVAGATFFVTEKAFNLYLISKVYSLLPAPYTVFVIKGWMATLVVHVLVTTLLAYAMSRGNSRLRDWAALAAAALAHYAYNFYMLTSGALR
jgi:hypothetical protein